MFQKRNLVLMLAGLALLFLWGGGKKQAEPVISQEAVQTAIEKDGAEYYAYMDYDAADPDTQAIIDRARMKVISTVAKDGWAVDGAKAYVSKGSGEIGQKILEFSELFPTEWYESYLRLYPPRPAE